MALRKVGINIEEYENQEVVIETYPIADLDKHIADLEAAIADWDNLSAMWLQKKRDRLDKLRQAKEMVQEETGDPR